MSIHRRSAIPLALVLSVIAGAIPARLDAQTRPLFEWMGRVDRDVHISMRGRDLRTSSGRFQYANGRLRLDHPLPRDEGRVLVRLESGRADVDVIQQPSYRNDFTTIVRIRERGRGSDRVRIAAHWRSTDRDRRGNRDHADRDDDWWDDDRWDDDRWDRRDRDGRQTIRWRGEVDDAVEIRVQGSRVTHRTLSGDDLRDVRVDPGSGLPRDPVELYVESRDGRGTVTVVQQPSSRNGYTAVIRIHDPRPGADRYAFDLTWRERWGR